MIAKEKFGLLMMFILFFSIVYLFLDDSHFSGINTLEEMIRNEILQKKIDPIVEKEVKETFQNNEEKEIQKKTEEITEDLEKEELIVNLAKPTLFDRFFKIDYN